MTKSKNSKKLTPEEIRELEEFKQEYRKLLIKMNGVKGARKTSKKYKANRELILRLKVAAAVLVASAGVIVGMSQESLAFDEKDKRNICTLASIVSDYGEQNSKIEVEGREIDLSAIAIVEGQIEEGENKVITYDQNGNKVEVTIDGENLNGIKEMERDDLENYVIYEVISEDGAELIQTGEGILNVSYGDYVVGKEQHDQYIDVLYPTGEEILKGKIDEKSLEIVDELFEEQYQDAGVTKMVVDTAEVGYDELNFRSDTNYEKYSIMMQIPNGTIIDSTGETIIAEGREWTKVKYEGETGWVATEFLDEVVRKEQQQDEQLIQEFGEQEYIESTGITNPSGGVTIIDVSTMTAQQLRNLLEDGIPTSLSNNKSRTYNTQGVAGKINGVKIKIGASGYGKGEFKQTDYDAYKELVAVCEELGVPYGFYFYATSINMEEAKTEVEYVENTIKDLENEFEMKNNKLPFTWDRELTGKSDRQYKKDITEVVAYQINTIQSDRISENVLLYMPGRIADEKDSDQIIDLEKLKSSLNNPENVAIWLCAPVNRNGNQTQRTEKYIDMIENKYQMSVVSEQKYLDLISPTGGRTDINSMDLEYYSEITGEKDVVAEQTEVEEYER